ncbi:dihydroorotase [Desulfitobacterium metallireducens]|uniref:Dihydroorotase n=1 Tax=Desulfitobacterium metallireducens DSM 15288 TaxID=871968 RepID=W0EDV3_9FIRM|nr:dihydroorotase [Desulfitobacterium metallireducens]AHF07678.1 dihydroorotase [Desulfitobacterium metallireducens DSM 15288]
MWWLKNVKIVDLESGSTQVRDVLIEGERILEITESLTEKEVQNKSQSEIQVIDGTGKYLFPGLIDVHTHLREPGQEEKEEIATGARAALKGGFTTILAMPNTKPVLDQRALVEFVSNQGERAAGAKVYPIGAITKGEEGKELTEMVDLAAGGAKAFSDDGREVQNAELLRLAMEYVKLTGLPLISHCEDDNLARGGSMHKGEVSARLGLRGIPSSAESVMVARDILLAEETGSKLHLAHISAKESVELIRAAKLRGVDVTAEVNPHHLIFTDEAVAESNYNTSYKVNPPLGSAQDREALLEGILDGTLDMLATDHAPHTWEEKMKPFAEAPFGIAGFETSLAAVWTYLVKPGKLPVEVLLRAWSLNPAQRFNLLGGKVQPGEIADLVLFDPEQKEKIESKWFTSKAQNTPFLGQELQGFACMVWVNGQLRLGK